MHNIKLYLYICLTLQRICGKNNNWSLNSSGKKNNAGILFSNLWSTIFLLGKRCYIYHFFKHAHNLRSVCNHGVGLDRSSVQFSVPCLWDCKCTVILCCCWFCILWFLLNNKIRKDKNHSKFFFLIYKIVMYQCMMQYFMGLEKISEMQENMNVGKNDSLK